MVDDDGEVIRDAVVEDASSVKALRVIAELGGISAACAQEGRSCPPPSEAQLRLRVSATFDGRAPAEDHPVPLLDLVTLSGPRAQVDIPLSLGTLTAGRHCLIVMAAEMAEDTNQVGERPSLVADAFVLDVGNNEEDHCLSGGRDVRDDPSLASAADCGPIVSTDARRSISRSRVDVGSELWARWKGCFPLAEVWLFIDGVPTGHKWASRDELQYSIELPAVEGDVLLMQVGRTSSAVVPIDVRTHDVVRVAGA